MGIISILLGIIGFCAFTYAGIKIADFLVNYKALLALSLTSLGSVSDGALIAVVVGIFTFIGLLIGMNLVMHGINYNKLCKLQTLIKRH